MAPRPDGAARKSLYVTIGSLSNIALGFAFQIFLAQVFGLSQAADIYTLGTMFPTLFATVVIGSTPSVIVPALNRQMAEHGGFSGRVFFRPSLAIMGFAILMILISFAIAPVISGSINEIGNAELLILISITALSMPLIWITAIAQSVLVTRERFLIVGFSGAINGVGLLAFSVMLYMADLKVLGLGVAFVLGYVVQAVVLGLCAVQEVRRNSVVVAGERIEGLAWPLLTLIGAAFIYKSQPLIERALASAVEGGPAAFNYATKLSQAVLMASTLGLSMISLPSISRNVSVGAHGDGWRIAMRVSTFISVLSAPLVATGIVVSKDVVTVIYGTTSFDPDAVGLIASVLTVSLVGVLFSALSGPTVNYLYATSRYRFVAVVSIGTTLLGAVLSWIGAFTIGLWGIALGSVVAFVVNFAVYLTAARRQAQIRWGAAGLRQFGVVVVTLGVAWLVGLLTEPILAGGYVQSLVRTCIVGAAAIVAAASFHFVFREKHADPLLGTR